MQQLVLHHYPNSPFSEKIRLIMGFKGLHWSSVHVPSIMPKPDVVSLTGGYRRTPFLQIGADIYCDTALMASTIDRLAPQPSLYPSESAGIGELLAEWADSTLFWICVSYTMQPEGLAHMFGDLSPDAVKAFSADRAAMRANAPRMRAAEARACLRLDLARIESMLASGHPWLLGSQACIADFSVYHCLWFILRGGPVIGRIFSDYPKITAWMDRMRAIGHGVSEKMDGSQAIDLARSTSPLPSQGEFVDVHGFEPGTLVTVTPADYAKDPVTGQLIESLADSVGLLRHDERAGDVVVHFPRIGYEIRKVE